MNASNWMLAKRLFHAALKLHPTARPGFLEAECAHSKGLRAHVETLLAAHEEAGDFLDKPLTGLLEKTAARPERLGNYHIIDEIAQGGMGVVYRAEDDGLKRRVALKVIRPDQVTPEQLERFQQEAWLLARLRHPGIAQVYEIEQARLGGVEQPFLAMEYVDGIPLDEYAESKRLDNRARLDLFTKVCDAMEYAHAKGVIHRDLKPSNILVDAEGQPRILDFGLAKATSDEPQSSGITSTGHFLGSLAWMSPEQADGISDEIDIRTDVYSLGVILYQMLTGAFPYPVSGPFRDVLSHIQDTEPTRPSTIRRHCSKELETIVLKALAKDRDRRYQSAGDLARDIRHYLAGEPIEAKRDSTWYVLRKQLGRHRRGVALAAGFILLLMASSVVAWTLYASSEYHRLEAEQRGKAEVEAHELAEARAERLRREDYVHRIALAQAAQQNGNVRRTKQALDGCPDDLKGWEWHRLAWLTDCSSRTVCSHGQSVQTVACSPDGSSILVGGAGGMLRLVDTSGGSELERFLGHESTVRSASFSFGGKLVVAAGRDKAIRVWDAKSGHEIATLGDGVADVHCVAFSPDATRVAASHSDMRVRVWDVETRAVAMTFEGHSRHVYPVAFTPDGKQLLSGGEEGTVKVWDTATGDEIWALNGHSGPVRSVAVSPYEAIAASGSGDGTVRVWDLRTGKLAWCLAGHRLEVTSVAFSPKGRWIASGSRDATVRIWDSVLGTESLVLRGHEADVMSVCFSPDGNSVYSASDDASIKLWDAQIALGGRDGAGNPLWTLAGHTSHVASIDFSPDGSQFASGSWDGSIKLWDTASGENLATSTARHGRVWSVAFTPDGKKIISGHGDGTVGVWDFAASQNVRAFGRHGGEVLCVACSPVGPYIASGGSDARIKVWDMQTGEESPSKPSHRGRIFSVAFSLDGRQIASGSEDGTVRLWLTSSGEALPTVFRHGSAVMSVAFSPDGQRIISGAADTVRVWDAVSGVELTSCEVNRFSAPIYSVSLSPDGQRIAAGRSRVIGIWDADTGVELLTLDSDDDQVRAVAFSPDGERLISAGAWGTMRVWETARGSHVGG